MSSPSLTSTNEINDLQKVDTHIRSTCPYCGVGCGVVAERQEGTRAFTIKGDTEHPANAGRLCSKGSALAETCSTLERIEQPYINKLPASWDQALDHVSDNLTRIIKEHGQDSVMLYVSGQLLTEDYYVANKFTKGFLGNNNIDSNSRLCMSSAVAGYKRAFGSDTVPNCYEDIEDAELFIICGSNMAWCHPVLFQRLKTAQEADNKKVVVIDPRETDSCAIANLHLPIKPGTDTILFNGLFAFLVQHEHLDHNYLQHCDNFEEAYQAAKEYDDLKKVSQLCDIDEQALLEFYTLFAQHEKTVTFYSMGVNQSSAGTDKVNSIINAHAISGKIGKPGAGPFSITGQPNAMGGREVGALSNLLAAHLDLTSAEDRSTLQEFWQSPQALSEQPGITAGRAAEAIRSGQVKAIWIMATNPVVSLTQANEFAEALKLCELVIVSDCSAQSDTSKFADVLFPAQGWSEKDGTVTNSERVISRQRSILPPHAQAKPDWWIITQVAQRMGFSGFSYQSPYEIFSEHVALSAYKNKGTRSFNLSGLQELSEQAYQNFEPTRWPILSFGLSPGLSPDLSPENTQQEDPQPIQIAEHNHRKHFFADGISFHANKKIHLIPIHYHAPQSQATKKYPLVLNTGRSRDQWHTMTRTGLASRLNQHLPEPFIHIHPKDAQHYGVEENALITLSNQHGRVIMRAQLSEKQRLGELFSPMHWSDEFTKNARIGQLIHANLDPFSKQPEFKFTPVSLGLTKIAWEGKLFISTSASLDYVAALLNKSAYWAKNKHNSLVEYTIADEQNFDTQAFKNILSDSKTEHQQVISYADAHRNDYRFIIIETLDSLQNIEEENVIAAFYFSNNKASLPNSTWLRSCFEKPLNEHTAPSKFLRQWLVAGKPAEGDFDVGNIICSCFTVGEKTIQKAINEHKLVSTQAIGTCLKAGTNCGSCVPELQKILDTH